MGLRTGQELTVSGKSREEYDPYGAFGLKSAVIARAVKRESPAMTTAGRDRFGAAVCRASGIVPCVRRSTCKGDI